MARKPYRMTPARRAALKKAQAASARKRSRGALAKNVARGAIGSSRGSRKTKYKVARAAGAVAVAAGVVAVGMAVYHNQNKGKGVKPKSTIRTPKTKRTSGSSNARKRAAFKAKTAPIVETGRANRHNRVFVTNSRGKTSVRKRY